MHLAEGNRGEALRQYELCRRLLRDRLGLEPSARLDALCSRVDAAMTIAVTPRPGMLAPWWSAAARRAHGSARRLGLARGRAADASPRRITYTLDVTRPERVTVAVAGADEIAAVVGAGSTSSWPRGRDGR